jgi:hypothetical protein
MNGCFMPYSNHKRNAIRVYVASCSHGFSERVAQKEISRIRFNGDMSVKMLCLQLRLQAISINPFRSFGDTTGFVGYHRILHGQLETTFWYPTISWPLPPRNLWPTNDVMHPSMRFACFGWAPSNPLIAVEADAQPDRPLPSDSSSLIEIDQPNVLLIGTESQPTARCVRKAHALAVCSAG